MCTMLMTKEMYLVLLLAIAFATRSAEAQLPDCYFQEVNLVPCLTSGAARKASEICCQALNQALVTGQKCLCSILFSTNLFLDSSNPIPTSPQGIVLPGCNILLPSLSACQEVAAFTTTPPPTEEMNSTGATVSSPLTSNLVPNSTEDDQREPVSEGQKPMDLVPQSGNTDDRSRVSGSRSVPITNNLLCISCILLAMSVQTFSMSK